jgi:hypothetical protein
MLGVIFGNQFDIDQRYQGKRAEKARIDEIVARWATQRPQFA